MNLSCKHMTHSINSSSKLLSIHSADDLLDNKIILITGATRGIGKTLALNAAKYGAQTILLGKNKKKLNAIYDEIMDLQYPEPTLLPVNLAGANPGDYQEIAKSIGTEFGRLDGLVHNAATLGIKTELIHYDVLKWYEAVQVNLNAPFLLTKELLPLLKLSKHSSIIFTTASEGLQGQAYQGAYGVCKAALKNLMEVLAAECDTYTNIRVNAVNPHKVYSGIYTQNYPGSDPSLVPSTDDIIPLYLNLLGDFSEKIHGETFTFSIE